MEWPNADYENMAAARGFLRVCGIDEAGRGPWAGPVVAAAVILDFAHIPAGLNDSKKLPEAKREALFALIMHSAEVGVGIVTSQEIDLINILQATYLAMQRAVLALANQPDFSLIDGNRAPALSCSIETIIGGDSKSLSIAAASIVAKVTRDRLMMAMDSTYPGYNFSRHKGYGTAAHAAALTNLGPCAEHRRSFKPIKALLSR